ncbi:MULTISPECIES: adenylate kinase [Anaerofustis]|uniref:adenylate kinase n=1 Tax=Anaerofustis TaxID=264995 RepID=UPI0011074E03|nr:MULTISPECIES: adenylate kinase [Anaerofustis]MCO8194584.1 adenylate kinase [Anaerofustis sp. NSJ-163]
MKLILLGPPGAGKGTQASKIVDKYNLVHISTGDIFRKNLSENTPLGQKAKEYMDKGLLVPDDVTVEMVEDRLSWDDIEGSYMLDGFPRTISQAESLDKILEKNGEKLDLALCIEADYSLLTKRITGRRMCKCGATYHVEFQPPKTAGICDKCGGELYQRDDDKEDTVVKRLKEYEEKTQPLVDYYKKQNILKTVNGSRTVEEVFEDISKILDECK